MKFSIERSLFDCFKFLNNQNGTQKFVVQFVLQWKVCKEFLHSQNYNQKCAHHKRWSANFLQTERSTQWSSSVSRNLFKKSKNLMSWSPNLKKWKNRMIWKMRLGRYCIRNRSLFYKDFYANPFNNLDLYNRNEHSKEKHPNSRVVIPDDSNQPKSNQKSAKTL